MSTNTRPASLAPPATAAAPQPGPAEQRFVCGALQLFRFCPFARCRRMRACHGEPQRCLDTHAFAVPPEARVVPEAMLAAARSNRVWPGEGDRWLKQDYRRETAVFKEWIAALDARDQRRERYALLARFRRSRQRRLNNA